MMVVMFILFLLTVLQVTAQLESAYWLRVDFNFPIAGSFGSISSKGEQDMADHLLENEKKSILMFLAPGLSMDLGKRINLHYSFQIQTTGLNTEKALSDLIKSSPDYFVQERPVHGNVQGSVVSSFLYTTSHAGLGYNMFHSKRIIFQPYVDYIFGRIRIAHGKYSFKSFESNDFFVRDYKESKIPLKGYSIGLKFKSNSQNKDKGGFLEPINFFIEYSHLNAEGTASVGSSYMFGEEVIESYNLQRSYQVFRVGAILRLGFNMIKRQSTE